MPVVAAPCRRLFGIVTSELVSNPVSAGTESTTICTTGRFIKDSNAITGALI
jgi:hypothetical protein